MTIVDFDLAEHWRIGHAEWLAKRERKRRDRRTRAAQRSYGVDRRNEEKITRIRKEAP